MTPSQNDIAQIGYWSEIKLDIINEYAQAYSAILSKQTRPALKHVYVDGFSGSGVHQSKTGELVLGIANQRAACDATFQGIPLH